MRRNPNLSTDHSVKRIVINALQYKPNSSGIGVTIRELFGRYVEETIRHCLVILPQDGPAFPAGRETDLIRVPIDHSQGLRRILFQSFLMGRKYCKDAVLLTTDSKTAFFLPKSCKLVPLITDLAVYRMPEVYQWSRILLWRLQYAYIRRRANLFLTVSEFTKQEMEEILHIPPEKIKVIPIACSKTMARVKSASMLASAREKYRLSEHFILFVGNNNPRKNLERTIRAFDLMKERTGLNHQLVIAGELGWKFDRAKVMGSIHHSDEVLFIGFVADEDLPALYSAAELFVFPTLYEGFGIPVLEAQACGTPVVISNVSSLPEVAGNGAVQTNPYDIENICRSMCTVLADKALAADLVEKGYKNVRRFSWDSAAARLDEIVERNVF